MSRVFFKGNAMYCFFGQGDIGLISGIIREAEETYQLGAQAEILEAVQS